MKLKKIIVSLFSILLFIALTFVLVSYPPATALCNPPSKKIEAIKLESGKFKSYPGFGIALPDNYDVHGIDVSRHQKNIDWENVANSFDKNIGISFAFIKATEGRTVSDDYFNYNWKQCKKHNILRGAYHFFRPHLTAEEQANHFFRTVTIDKEDLPPVLDIEVRGSGSPTTLKRKVKRWLVLAEKQYGVTPIIYTNFSFYKNYFSGKEFAKYPMWIAHYQTEDLNNKLSNWNFWQHNESGKVSGIKSGVDFNVFNGTYDELLKLCKK